MSLFKKHVAADLKAVFLNTAELADTHNICGVDMPAMIDTDILQERNSKSYSEYAEGVARHEKMLFVAEDDLGFIPQIDSIISVDGRDYYVIDCQQSAGMLEISIGANVA